MARMISGLHVLKLLSVLNLTLTQSGVTSLHALNMA